jgi:hypothetical protein
MANRWPTPDLPSWALAEFTAHSESNIISFAVQNGPEKRRRTSTKKRKYQSTMLQLTGAQVETLMAFYDETLNGGIDEFEWKDMITDDTVNMRFASEPRYTNVIPGPDPEKALFETTIDLEVMS